MPSEEKEGNQSSGTLTETFQTPKSLEVEQRISADSWDTEAWVTWFMEAQNQPIEKARPVYKLFLSQFPTAGRYWKMYIEHELREGKEDIVEETFKEALLICHHLDLWKAYTDYIRSRKSRAEAIEAYEFALKHLGLDINANILWSDYIQFIEDWEPRSPQEENTKRDQLRALYQRAIQTPMYNLDNFWKEYEQFENSLNRTLAKGLLSEYQPLYSAARAEFRARRNRREGIFLNTLACPPTANSKGIEQAKLWKKYIDGEKANPHKLEPEQLHQRIATAYEQAIICLYRYPDLWLEVYLYYLERNEIEQSKDYLYRGIQACPDRPILYFCLAEMEEFLKNYSVAKSLYEELLKLCPSSLVYIEYMKFARRVEGIQSSRKVFARARKDNSLDYRIFVAAAEMEYYQNKSVDIAVNIFELGLGMFSQEIGFLLEYISFLWLLGDERNLQALFERILFLQLPEEDAAVIWDKYCLFVDQFYGIEKRKEIERRRIETLGGAEKFLIESTLCYHSFRDLSAVTATDLYYIGEKMKRMEEFGHRKRMDVESTIEKMSSYAKNTTTNKRSRVGNKSSDSINNLPSSGSLLESLQILMNMFPLTVDVIPDINYVMNQLLSTPDTIPSLNDKSRGEKRKTESNGASGSVSMHSTEYSMNVSPSINNTEDGNVLQDGGEGIRIPSRDIFRVRQAQRQAKFSS
eukprot:jgi/Galph1/3671/GphlegSOOS_G2317.1